MGRRSRNFFSRSIFQFRRIPSLACYTKWISLCVLTGSRSPPTPVRTGISPYRDQQFQNISSLRSRFQRQGLPILSVDSKKRELIGNFKNTGAKWDRSPVPVNDHDFLSDASGWASPTAFRS